MKLKLFDYTRTLLQVEDTVPRAMGSPSLNYSPTPDTVTNTSSPPPAPELRDPFGSSRSPLDSSLALTILVLLTALFFMAFFSIYIRRFSDDNSSSNSSSRIQTSSLRQHSQSSCRTKGGGLDPSAVRSLPLIPYYPDEKHPSLNDCSICLSEFEQRETVKIIPYCRHGFHPMCIDTWLSSHVTCPLCRSSQLFLAVEDARLDVVRMDEEVMGGENDRTVED